MLWGNATTEAGDFLGIIVSLDEMWLCKSLCFVFSMCSNCIQLDLTTATVNCNKILEKKKVKIYTVSLTWLFLPQLCRWHSTQFVLSPAWNPGGSTNLCLAIISVTVCTPSEAQPQQDQKLFLPGKASLAHDLSITIEKSVVSQNPSNLGVTLGEQLCFAAKNNLLLQIHSPLHQEDMPIPNPGGGAGPGPGSSHLASQLWQLCSSSTLLVFTYPRSSTIYRFSAPCIGYQWLLQSDLRQKYLPTVLQMVQVHPTWRRWSNHTPQPVCYCQSAWYFLTINFIVIFCFWCDTQ